MRVHAENFPRVDVLNELKAWTLVKPDPTLFASQISYGKLHYTFPASRQECKETYYDFPSRDLASVSYFGTNNTFNAILWLNPNSEAFNIANVKSAIAVRNFSDGYYRIDALKNWNMNLDRSTKDLLKYLHEKIGKFVLVANTSFFIDTNTIARNLTIIYPDDSEHSMYACQNCREATEILVKKSNMLYLISIFEYNKKLSSTSDFRSTLKALTHSIEFGNTSPIVRVNSEWNIYENEKFRIRTQYPSHWSVIEYPTPPYSFANPKSYINDNRTLIVAFQPTNSSKSNFEILLDQMPIIMDSFSDAYLKSLSRSYSSLPDYIADNSSTRTQ